MRILVVTNLYPPHFIGGYELGCRDVVEALRARGHDVLVLTSTYGNGRDTTRDGVHRRLRIEPFTPGWMPSRILAKPGVYLHNARVTRETLAAFRPDVLYQWSPSYISLAPAFAAVEAGVRVRFYVSDQWMAHWEMWPSPSVRRRGESVLALAGKGSIRSLDLSGAHFASRFLQDLTLRAGRDVERAAVIHWGVDVDVFRYRQREHGLVRRLLFVGQIGPHKGVHTAIEAFRMLATQHPGLELSIAGGSVFPDYERSIRALAAEVPGVRLLGQLPRAELPALYAEHDVLLFPSIWDEPFSLTVLEAMACGTPVVAADTGGTAEAVAHGKTGLTFPKDDARACAERITMLLGDPPLAQRLSEAARRRIEESFTLPAMIDRIESALR